MMFLDWVLEEPDQKGQVESAKYDAFLLKFQFLGVFQGTEFFY